MKKSLTIITVLLLCVAPALPELFKACYSLTLNRTYTYCDNDGCIYTICTPECTYCSDLPDYTGKTCQQNDEYTAVLQGYGPSDESATRCINHVCTGGVEYGLPSTEQCWHTIDNICGG
jgi:hypothetical protein